MNELLMLAIIIAGLWFLLVYLRVPALAAFFALLIGHLLSLYTSAEAYNFISGVFGINQINYIQLTLLLLPLAVTVLLLKGRSPKSKLAMEILPSLFLALVAILLTYSLLPALETLVDEATLGNVDQYKTVIIIAASASGLLSAWTAYPKSHGKHSKH